MRQLKISRIFQNLIVLCLLTSFAYAQADIIQVTHEQFNTILNLKWSANGEMLVFQNTCCNQSGVTLPEPNWYAYDITTNTLSQSEQWQISASLTPNEIESADINPERFSFPSPSGRYLFYATSTSETARQPHIFDRQENRLEGLPYELLNDSLGINLFDVQWGDDETAVLALLTETTPYQPMPFYYYASGYNDSDENNDFFASLYNITFNGDEYGLVDHYDISPDGTKILTFASKVGEDFRVLAYYDPQNPSDSTFIPPSEVQVVEIYTAQFLEGDNDRIVYLNDSGIYVYDKSTGANTLIRDDIKSTEWDQMLFSPGGKHLALERNRFVYVVDLTDDLPDTNPSPTCDYDIAAGDEAALIQAIHDAKANPGAAVICLANSTYSFTSVAEWSQGPNALPNITDEITIVGNGATLTRDSSLSDARVARVAPGGTLTVENVIFDDWDTYDSGGVFYVEGTLSLTDSTLRNSSGEQGGALYSTAGGTLNIASTVFENNSTSYERGGAIYNRGSLDISNSQFTGNQAGNDGAGIYNNAGTVTLTDTDFTNNATTDTGDFEGGALFNQNGTVTITNSDFTNNRAGAADCASLSADTQDGGAILNTGSSAGMTITGGTFDGNCAKDDGGAWQKLNCNSYSQQPQLISHVSSTGKMKDLAQKRA